MTPLEAIARAICPEVLDGSVYEDCPVDDVFTQPRYAHLVGELLALARKAVLELAKADFPPEVSKAGRETLLTYGNNVDDACRAMLTAIAGDEK